MKQCPRCKQLFLNEMLKFCRSDGSQLVSITAFLEEAATMMLSPGQITDRSTPLFSEALSRQAIVQKVNNDEMSPDIKVRSTG